MKRIFVVILCIFLLSCFMAGCSAPAQEEVNSTEAEEKEPVEGDGEETPAEGTAADLTFGVLVFDYANDYVYHVRTGIEDAAAEAGVELLIEGAENDQAKQIDQCDTLISKGIDALLCNLVVQDAGITIIEKCKAADIPVVFVNKHPPVEDMASYDRCWYVGAAIGQPGEVQAEMVMEDFVANPDWDKNGDGVMQYVILKGEDGHVNAEGRTDEILRIFEENKDTFPTELLDMQVGMWNAANGKDITEAWLGKFGDEVEAVLSNNDAMALGVIEAYKGAGYFEESGGKFVAIYGINALAEGLDAMEEGTMVATVMSDMHAEGESTFQIAYNYCLGKDIMEGIEYEMLSLIHI